ncbi:MAG: hypothetical protein A2Y15_00795 [Clostridiales bacterium GWF2_36_10]|nr:MAG: hypothetical protein A2Y15_00795 [Clostridiales bacterium GWF2_36_10]
MTLNSNKSVNIFNAVVMAGGFGSRLAPMTNNIPKPMLPVYGRSTFERILDLLVKNGFSNAAVTTMYLPEQIEAVKHEKINLSFFKETEPKGSAGAVRALIDNLDDTILIVSGDAVCDFDLKKHLDKHISEKREATILLTRTKKPQEFGTVLTDSKTNRIKCFLEKPSWADTLSNLINTGIYILNKSIIQLIPERRFFDFGRDLFPLLLQKNVPLYGEEANDFWCDIGSFSDFYNCNMSFSGGKNIFGKDCCIRENAKVNNSIFFNRIYIGESDVKGSIICDDVIIGDGCIIPEGCVIGAECVIGDNAVLSKGVKIADKIKIGRGARIMGNVFFSSAARHLFGDEGISGMYGSDIDGELCFKLGQGLTSLGKPARIGVMSDGSENGDLLADIIKVGVRSNGGYILELEEGFPELAMFASHEYNLDACVYVSFHKADKGIKSVSISLLEKNGLPLSRDKQRKAESAMREKLPPPKTIPEPEVLVGENRVKFLYCHYLQQQVGQLGRTEVLSKGKSKQANFFFSNAKELNAETDLLKEEGEISGKDTFIFNDDGSVCAQTADGNELSFWQLFALAVQSGDKKELYLPQYTPEIIEQYLNNLGFITHFYNDNDSEERKNAFDTHFYNDSVLLSLLVCKYLHINGITLDEALQTLPQFFLRSIDIDIDEEDKADMIGILAEECDDCSRGVRLRNDKGSIAVFPRANGSFRVYAEAVSAEFADDLCDFAEMKIKGKK